MNTLQLPRDIEKALQLSWDMHPLTEKQIYFEIPKQCI